MKIAIISRPGDCFPNIISKGLKEMIQKQGFEAIDDSAQQVLEALNQNDGILILNDNSHPEEIKSVLKMSKKTFKQAVGKLYRYRKIALFPDRIEFIEK